MGMGMGMGGGFIMFGMELVFACVRAWVWVTLHGCWRAIHTSIRYVGCWFLFHVCVGGCVDGYMSTSLLIRSMVLGWCLEAR